MQISSVVKKEVDNVDPFTKALIILENYKLKPVTTYSPMLGADPEFFFKNTKDNSVVGAEKIIEKDGLIRDEYKNIPAGYTKAVWDDYVKKNASRIIVDGVAAEINPRPTTCRGTFGNEIIYILRALRDTLKKNNNGIAADLNETVIEISEEELQSLDEKSRQFGCAPSLNIHNPSAKITVDPTKYLKRGAGGHIHLGIEKVWQTRKNEYGPVEELILFLDILVGNTFVLIDRNPANVERRKHYGRAGEYRLPPHGLEYRTLSNVWLTSIPLFSLAFGLARQAVEIYLDKSPNGKNIRDEIKKSIDQKDIIDAINNNDGELAYKNFIKILPILIAISNETGHHTITRNSSEYFLFFVEKIWEHGLTYWFPKNPLDHWCDTPDSHELGCYKYLTTTVRNNRNSYLKHPI